MMTHSDCLEQYGSDYRIQQKLEAGELFKIGKGLYSEEEHVPELAELSYKYPNAILTMRNAFYMHGLTDVIPDEYDFATDRDAAKISDKRVRQYFIPRSFLRDGVEQYDHKGYKIPMYSKERMLIELLRYKSKLPFDYYKEIILNFRRIMRTLDIQKIQDYALASPKSNKVMETLQMEVL